MDLYYEDVVDENEQLFLIDDIVRLQYKYKGDKKPSQITYKRVYAKKQRKFSRKEFNDGIIRKEFKSTVYVSRDVETICYETYCSESFRFGLSDVIEIFKVFIDGYSYNSDNNMITFGSNIFNIKTKLLLEMDVLMPSILMVGDEPSVPLMIQTATKQEQINIDIDFKDTNIISLQNGNSNQKETITDIKFLRTYIPLKS